MSTLTELSSFVTSKLMMTDTASVTACKSFINARYRLLWESSLWTETLGIASKAVSAGDTSITLDGTPSVTFYHSSSAPATYVDFVVAARFTKTGEDDGVESVASDWMRWFQIDPNAWNDVTSRRAAPTGFIPLPKDGSGYMRIKPVPIPSDAGTMYVLGKLKWVALGDSDSPCLRGADNALLAYAEADMLERSRQYAKAQNKFAEASAAVQVMRDIERGQQQMVSQIIPMEEGYYDPAGGPL
jgi:hypothetical protein